MIEARKFGDAHQAQSLAEWTGGKYNPEELAPLGGHAGVVPGNQVLGSKGFAELGDWIIRFPDGTVRIDPAGSQDGYCTDCGEPVWWYDSHLTTRHGTRWCQGLDHSHPGMTRHHALPGMAQYVVQARDGEPCQCLDRPEPHIHQIVPVPVARPYQPGDFTEERIRDEAVGTLHGWLDGWTEPREGEPQRKIIIGDVQEDHVDITVEGARFTGQRDQRFRIHVRAEELHDV